MKSILERNIQEELVLFKNEARHKGFLEQLSKVMNEFQSGGIEVEISSIFFEASLLRKRATIKRIWDYLCLLYRSTKRGFVHQKKAMHNYAA